MLGLKPNIYQLASNGMELSNRLEDKLLVPEQLADTAEMLVESGPGWYGDRDGRSQRFRQY